MHGLVLKSRPSEFALADRTSGVSGFLSLVPMTQSGWQRRAATSGFSLSRPNCQSLGGRQLAGGFNAARLFLYPLSRIRQDRRNERVQPDHPFGSLRCFSASPEGHPRSWKPQSLARKKPASPWVSQPRTRT